MEVILHMYIFYELISQALPVKSVTDSWAFFVKLLSVAFLSSCSQNPVDDKSTLVQVIQSRPNWIPGPGLNPALAGISGSCGSKNGVARLWQPNSEIYSQNDHFGLVYDMIYRFLGMEAKNYKFGLFCKQCHPSVAPGDADIRPQKASRIHTCHCLRHNFVC